MRNPVTIPLTNDKSRNLIIDLENVNSIYDLDASKSEITFVENGKECTIKSELSATDLYEEICSPSK